MELDPEEFAAWVSSLPDEELEAMRSTLHAIERERLMRKFKAHAVNAAEELLSPAADPSVFAEAVWEICRLEHQLHAKHNFDNAVSAAISIANARAGKGNYDNH
jgi:hypothetical protein